MTHDIHIIGGGLAGSEAAWQLAEAGFQVKLSEMRGSGEMTPAHQTDDLAELVCSNSFRSDDATSNAVGLLHAEMRALGSLILREGDVHKVPAGSALAVDRDGFSAGVTAALTAHPNITIVRERVDALPDGLAIVATGPLTAAGLASSIGAATGAEALAFFDAIAPIVHFDSIDMETAWFQSRWNKGEGKDYINCALDKEQYLAFHAGLIAGEKTEFKEWEKDTPYFEGCMPIEVAAERGLDTLRFGPMKLAACGRPAPSGQCAGYALEHRRLPDQAEACRAGQAVPHHPRPRECRIRAARRPAPQHLHPLARIARHNAQAEEPPEHPLRRPDHRLRGLCRKRSDRPARRPLRRGRVGGQCPHPATGGDSAWRAAPSYHRRGSG
jgi:tRNA:m(5)U-54 methyltransferase